MPERDSNGEGSPSCFIRETLGSCCSLYHDSKVDDDTEDVKNTSQSTGNENGKVESGQSKADRKQCYSCTGCRKDSEKKSKCRHKKINMASILKLFRYATAFDWLLMFLGTLAAIAHGFVLPGTMLLIAEMSNSFIYHQASRLLVNETLLLTRGELRHISMNLGKPRPKRSLSPVPRDLGSEFFNNEQFGFNGSKITVSLVNLTGGNVQCNASYQVPLNRRVAVNFTLTGMLQFYFGFGAQCLDNALFTENMNKVIFGFAAIVLMAILLGSIQVSLFQTACERQIQTMRLKYYQSVLSQDIGWFDTNPGGEVCRCLFDVFTVFNFTFSDIDKVQDGMGANVSIFIQWVSTFIAGFIVGFYSNWILSLLLLGLTPFIVAPAAIFHKVAATLIQQEQQHYASAGAVAEEVLSAIRTVVAFGGEFDEAKRYDKHLSSAKTIGVKRGLATGASLSAVFFVLFASYAVAFWFGGYIVSVRLGLRAEIVSVFVGVIIGAFYLGQSMTNLGQLMTALATAQPIFQTIDRKPTIGKGPDKSLTPDDFESKIEFKDVTFSYPMRPDVKILDGINLSVGAGQTLALVGPSGCGKSTLVNLILRFYDVTSGQLLIGGKDVKSLDLNWLRSKIGVVRQEPILFNTTIAENIRFGNVDAEMEDIVRAAKRANAHDFILQLPKRYNTVVGEQGTQLSGGQKQRIAIARALIRDPKILLLDEATSALDSGSEASVLAALSRAREGRTTIVIAHRLSTIKNADFVVSINNGKSVLKGVPSDLFSEKGLVIRKEQARPPYSKFKVMSGSLKRLVGSLRRQTLRREVEEDFEDQPPVSLFKILQLNLKEWWIILIGMAGAAMAGAAFPLFAIIFAGAFDAFSMPYNCVLSNIHKWAALFPVLGLMAAIGVFLKTLCFSVSSENLITRVRSLVFRSMLRQEIGWFDDERHSTGTLTSLLDDDSRQLQGTAGTRLGTLVESTTALVVGHIIAFRFSWILTLILMGIIPLYIFSIWLHVKASAKFANVRRKANVEANEIVWESVEGIDTVVSLGLEQKFYSSYKRRMQQTYRHILLLSPLYGFSQGVLLLGYIISFRFGAWQVTLDPEHPLHANFLDLFKVFLALIFAALNVGLTSSLAPDYAKARLAARKIFGVMNRQPKIDGYSEEGIKLDKVSGDLRIQNVFFSYPSRPDAKVLQGLSISVKPGHTVALVGSSGCGKSTVVSLIERFYDSSTGSLQLDSTDLRDINIRWLRSQIGIVSQEPVLFDASIAHNIRYGITAAEISDEDVVNAAKMANIHHFVQSLPQGYKTNIGAKGTQLSGGQKQRIAIARALVRNPKILLLDEATSALDSESETIVQEALDRAQEGRTSIVIAHRFSTIYKADSIAVLEGGQIVEWGSHKELMAGEGMYYRLNRYQAFEISSES